MALGGNLRAQGLLGQTVADATNVCECELPISVSVCRVQSSLMHENRMSAPDAMWRYHSLNRHVPTRGRPVFRVLACTNLRLTALAGVAAIRRKAHGYRTVFTQKGTILCSIRLGSSQQLQPSLSRVVWKRICSAVSLVPPLAWRQATGSGLSRSPLALLALCVTTPGSAAKHSKLFAALHGQTIDHLRRRGITSAAFLRSKDYAHV